MTDAGNEFRTDGAAHRKERFAKSVRANVAVERSVRALTRRLRYRGTDVLSSRNWSANMSDERSSRMLTSAASTTGLVYVYHPINLTSYLFSLLVVTHVTTHALHLMWLIEDAFPTFPTNQYCLNWS